MLEHVVQASNSLEVSLRYIIYLIILILFVTAVLPAGFAFAGWLLGRHHYIQRAKDIAPLIAPLVTFGSFAIAAFVAYTTWFSPFRPVVQARPFLWRMGPGTPPSCPLNIVTYLTFFNAGAASGVVSDVLIEIELPKGKWIMELIFFVKPGDFYQDAFKPEIKVPFSSENVEGPFTPIFLAGRTQTTKAVSFCRGIGANDFDLNILEAGQHPIRLFARFNLAKGITEIDEAKIIFEADVLADLKAGKTVVGEVRHRDTDIKKLPRK